MSSGPDHYRQAEELLDFAGVPSPTVIALAQVHATLALAAANAATVEFSNDDGHPIAVLADPGWADVLEYERLSFDGGYTR